MNSYACHTCGERFPLLSHLALHKAETHGTTYWRCRWCAFKSADRNDLLQKHVYIRHRGVRANKDSVRQVTWAELKAEAEAVHIPSARQDIPGPSRQIQPRHDQVPPPPRATVQKDVTPVQQRQITPPPRSRVEQWEEQVTLLHCHTVETTYHPDGRKTVSHSSRWYALKLGCCAGEEPKTDPPTPGRLPLTEGEGQLDVLLSTPTRRVVRQLDLESPCRQPDRPLSTRRTTTPSQPRASTSRASPRMNQGLPGPAQPAESPNIPRKASPTQTSRSASPDWYPQQELCSVSSPPHTPPTPGRSPTQEAPKREAPRSASPSPIKTRRYKRIRVLEYVSDEERD